MHTRLINTKTFVTLALSLLLALVVLFPGVQTGALSGSQFTAGNIIDDATFFNSTTMSPQQIQDFLNSKVPVCDTNGQQIIYSQTRAEYGASRGNPAPFICLKDYSQSIPQIVNSGSDLCTGSIQGGTKSAALIIYDVAQACGINPQVLIVLLQKEQSLVTDDWPWTVQYQKATGYGCPDTAPCNAEYFGFFNQVYQAAKAFRRYEANPNSYNYKAHRNNFIYYHPSLGACGGTNVYIENQATANLYIYTPYQPNAAALNNLYGTGDGCSAYGNRNFWRMFNDWFGATHAPNYSSTPVSSWSSLPTGTMVKGDRSYIVFKVRNTSNRAWDRTKTFLGTAVPFDRGSGFHDGSWVSIHRPAQLKEATVEPGDIGTFEFWYRAPAFSGTFTERFSVVVEGESWTPYAGLFLTTTVVDPSYSANIVSLGSYKDATLKTGRTTDRMAPGESAYMVIRIKNVGNRIWKNNGPNPTRLATSGPLGRGSGFNSGWITHSRVANMDQTSVSPGQIGTFRFWYRAPGVFGTHNEQFTLVHEGKAWSPYFGFFLNTTVDNPEFSAQPLSAASNVNTATMQKNTRALVTFKVRNTGNYTWKKSNTRLGTAEPFGRISTFRYNTWLNANRTTTLDEATVAPGEVGTFSFWYQAPTNVGTYQEKFTPVVEGLAWVPYSGLFLETNVVD